LACVGKTAPQSCHGRGESRWHGTSQSPDTYADANVSNTAIETEAAASLAATNKTNKYSQLSATHIFTPVAIETAGT